MCVFIFNWAQFVCRKKGQNRIEEEHTLVNKLVLSAKNGDWETVTSVVGTQANPRHSHMLNIIPEKRRWGVLHQAVYWKRPEILRMLLDLPACDPQLKAKQCTSECGPTDSMTALQIAKEFNYISMVDVLSAYKTPRMAEQSIPTFQSYDGYCDNKGLSLISLTLSSYKDTFHPKAVSRNKSMISVLSDVFNDISTGGDRWQAVKYIVADSVYPVSEEKANDLSNCKTRDEFFSQVIRAYTNEDNTIYAYLNMAFRRQRQENYMPTGDDLAMGPYCVMYQMLLLFWNKLEAERHTTYRKMRMMEEDANMYVPGTRFVWQSIVSSALDKNHTHTFPSMAPTGNTPVLFIITNDSSSLWKPRNIEEHADFPETERTYPAGAKFMVTARSEHGGEIHISLQLL